MEDDMKTKFLDSLEKGSVSSSEAFLGLLPDARK